MKPAQWLLLVATAASFASSILIGKILIGALPPLTLAAMRVLLAAPLCFALLLAFNRDLPRTRTDRRTAVAASLGVIVIPYSCLAIGQQTIPSGLSGILYSMMPLFTLLVAHFVLHDERLGLRKVTGIVIGIAGVVAVIGPSLLGGLGEHAVAELVTLCGPLAYAFGTVLMRRSRHLDPIGLTTAMFLAATFVLVPVALIIEQPWHVRGGGLLLFELIALAIVGTILPAALNYLLVQQVGATRASVAMFLMPLIAVLFGVVFLDERLGLNALIGMGLILAGSLVVNGPGRGAAFAPARSRSAPGRRSAEPDGVAAPTILSPRRGQRCRFSDSPVIRDRARRP